MTAADCWAPSRSTAADPVQNNLLLMKETALLAVTWLQCWPPLPGLGRLPFPSSCSTGLTRLLLLPLWKNHTGKLDLRWAEYFDAANAPLFIAPPRPVSGQESDVGQDNCASLPSCASPIRLSFTYSCATATWSRISSGGAMIEAENNAAQRSRRHRRRLIRGFFGDEWMKAHLLPSHKDAGIETRANNLHRHHLPGRDLPRVGGLPSPSDRPHLTLNAVSLGATRIASNAISKHRCLLHSWELRKMDHLLRNIHKTSPASKNRPRSQESIERLRPPQQGHWPASGKNPVSLQIMDSNEPVRKRRA